MNLNPETQIGTGATVRFARRAKAFIRENQSEYGRASADRNKKMNRAVRGKQSNK